MFSIPGAVTVTLLPGAVTVTVGPTAVTVTTLPVWDQYHSHSSHNTDLELSQ